MPDQWARLALHNTDSSSRTQRSSQPLSRGPSTWPVRVAKCVSAIHVALSMELLAVRLSNPVLAVSRGPSDSFANNSYAPAPPFSATFQQHKMTPCTPPPLSPSEKVVSIEISFQINISIRDLRNKHRNSESRREVRLLTSTTSTTTICSKGVPAIARACSTTLSTHTHKRYKQSSQMKGGKKGRTQGHPSTSMPPAT